MGWIFGRKKEKNTLDLPPPPAPEETFALAPPELPRGDLPGVKGSDLDMPAAPDFTQDTFDEDISLPSRADTLAPQPTKKTMLSAQSPPQTPLRTVNPAEPLFIGIQDYKAILDHVSDIRMKIDQAEAVVHRLGQIKTNGDKEFELWRSHLEDIEKKLNYVDEVIAQAE